MILKLGWLKQLIGLKKIMQTDIFDQVKTYILEEQKRGKKGYLLKKRTNNKKKKSLEDLSKQVSTCKKCELYKTRTNTVFGTGDLKADLMFIGEAPGADEDLQGKPFVGRAGQLLTRIIEAMSLQREDVYIANVLKCRPPGNRNPSLDEIFKCEPYLLEQIELIKPKVLCALGTFAAQTLLKTKTTITSLRGEFHDYKGIPLLATYHPSYLLRNPHAKRDVWQDMKIIMKKMDLAIPRV